MPAKGLPDRVQRIRRTDRPVLPSGLLRAWSSLCRAASARHIGLPGKQDQVDALQLDHSFPISVRASHGAAFLCLHSTSSRPDSPAPSQASAAEKNGAGPKLLPLPGSAAERCYSVLWLCKSFRTASFSGTELHDSRSIVGDAAGSMPVFMVIRIIPCSETGSTFSCFTGPPDGNERLRHPADQPGKPLDISHSRRYHLYSILKTNMPVDSAHPINDFIHALRRIDHEHETGLSSHHRSCHSRCTA